MKEIEIVNSIEHCAICARQKGQAVHELDNQSILPQTPTHNHKIIHTFTYTHTHLNMPTVSIVCECVGVSVLVWGMHCAG